MNGSVNYINSVLNKILNFEDQDMVFDVFERTLGYWEVFLDDAIDSMTLAPYELDFVTSFPLERQRAALKYYFSQNKTVVDSVSSKEALTLMGKTLSLPLGKSADASSTVFIEQFKNLKTVKASEKQCLIVSEYEDLHQFLGYNYHQNYYTSLVEVAFLLSDHKLLLVAGNNNRKRNNL